ncbi:MAG: hypothetical protein IPK53_20570 [bacterium]|nr:hypothetical protein [bacterium]
MHHFLVIRWIEVILRTDVLGKIEELIRRLGRALIARLGASRSSGQRIDTALCQRMKLRHIGPADHRVAIGSGTSPWRFELARQAVRGHRGTDEAQFLGPEIVGKWRKKLCGFLGKRVICAGPDTDHRGLPFDPIPQLGVNEQY